MVRWMLLGSALLLGIGVPGWILVQTGEVPPVDDSDLEVPRWNLSSEENGLVPLTEAAALLDLAGAPESEALLSGESYDPRAAASLVARNEAAIDRLRSVIARERIELPPGQVDSSFDHAPDWQRLGKLLTLRSRVRLEAGDLHGARRDALDAVTLGHHVERARGGGLLPVLLGASIRSRGLEALRRVVTRSELDAAQARLWITALESRRADASTWNDMWNFEYQMMVGMMEREVVPSMREEQLVGWRRYVANEWLFDWPMTRTRFAEVYRELRRNSSRPCNEIEIRADLGTSRWDMLGIAARRNPTGEILVRVGTPELARYIERRCHVETRVSVTQAFVALRAWQVAHADLPDRLDQLVPGYLDSVPVDAFDGAPLRYSAGRRVVWSIGNDGVDGGGHGTDDFLEMSDPTFPIPF